ncbi:MAG: radical SAM protein [Elusimicrobia bacterium]|nr:radical SAM protein [Elusimicrobiota bacterium]
MLRIGFIFPSSDYLFDPFKGDPHTHFQILTVLESRLGDQVDLSLIDLRGISRNFALYHIHECDVYLHSVYTLDYNEQLSIVKGLRERYPKAKHIAGGPHAVVFQEECSKIFDSLVIGDGEESIILAIKDIMNSKLKPIYAHKGCVDINKYPYPLRKYLPKATIARKGLMTLKNKKGYDQLLSTTVMFSRGCPYRCYFCDIPKTKEYSPGIRFRKPEFIEQEIEYLKKDYDMQGISLLDEIGIPLVKKEAVPHLNAIGRTGILWRGQCRVDGINKEYAKLAKESGCITMCLGVESVSQISLDIINKKISVKQAKESIRFLKENGIETRIYMIIGLPGEPGDIVEQTWKFIKETSPDLVYLSLFTVRPGTEVFNNPKKFGIKHINKNWKNTMHMFSRYENETPTLTFEYDKQTPWGRGFDGKEIVSNYLELQNRIKENGMGPLK